MAKRSLWVVELKTDGVWSPMSHAFFNRVSARLTAAMLTHHSGDHTRVVRYSAEDK